MSGIVGALASESESGWTFLGMLCRPGWGCSEERECGKVFAGLTVYEEGLFWWTCLACESSGVFKAFTFFARWVVVRRISSGTSSPTALHNTSSASRVNNLE